MENFVGGLIGMIIAVAIGIAILIVLGFVLRWLWNTTMPQISGLKEITAVQAIKLIFIAAILFGGHRVITVPDDAPSPTEGAEMSQQ